MLPIPAGGLPVLELDDGTCIAESVAICRYLEGLDPEPNLMGRDFTEQAIIEMWSRRIELNIFGPAGRAFFHTDPRFANLPIKQFPDYGESQRYLTRLPTRLARRLAKGQAIHRRLTLAIAGIRALVAIDFATRAGSTLDHALKELTRWYDAVSSHLSARA